MFGGPFQRGDVIRRASGPLGLVVTAPRPAREVFDSHTGRALLVIRYGPEHVEAVFAGAHGPEIQTIDASDCVLILRPGALEVGA